MTKVQIISEYNALTQTVKDALNEYKAQTGNDYPRDVRSLNMSPSCASYGKDELEARLFGRQNDIFRIKEAIENDTNRARLLESEEGRKFVESLENRKINLQSQLLDVNEEMYVKFNTLLSKIGLKGWEMAPTAVAKVTPSYDHIYFTVCNPKIMYTGLHLGIDCNCGKFKMSVSTGVRGNGTINKREDEYHNFKAYVTLCDNNEEIDRWMDKEYRAMASKVYDIKEKMRINDAQLEDPYTAWMRNPYAARTEINK